MRIAALSWIDKRLPYLSIFHRIVIGNSIIIVAGAIGGTLLTRLLTDKAADLSLIAGFALIGTTISVLVNSWIIRSALRPLKDLRSLVDQIHMGSSRLEIESLQRSDPDIGELALVLHGLLLQLEERNNQLRALSERAITAQEDERKSIARSLHDDTGQALSMLIINLERLENRLPMEDAELRSKLESSRILASGILKELRKIIYDLRPTILDDLGLVPAIRWYARSVLEANDIQVRLSLPEEAFKLSGHLSTTLFRIAQEAINNIMRHANARVAEISLVVDQERVILKVGDDGQGFNPEHAAGQAVPLQHLGLLGIQERAALVGGEVEVESVPGKGTRLQICVPLLVEVEYHDEKDSDTVSRRSHDSPRWDPLST
jgi:two-component system, NarL family, sensor histidine kinase UhpB